MAQSGYTPILIYASGTTGHEPDAANMTSGASGAELALNYFDGKLFYKNASNVVTLLADASKVTPVTTFSAGTTGLTPSTATSGAVTLAGTLVAGNGGTGLASYTAGDVVYASGTTTLSKLGIGTTNYVMTSSGSAPQWSSSLTLTGLTDSGNLTFTGTGNRITGDFSNATFANRVAFQTSTTNGATTVYAIPNGTSTTSGFIASTDPSVTNGSEIRVLVTSTAATLTSSSRGSGTVLPLTFDVGGERMRINSSGNVLIGGTADRGTTVGAAHLDLFNGTAPAGTLTNGISLYSSSGDFMFMDAAGSGYKVGFRNVPPVGTKTTSYSLATTDIGKYVQVGTSGSITIPDATFSEGDVVSIFNNTSGSVTITCSITTAYISGTDTDKATMTLATRGIATVFFISGTVCVVSGSVT